MIEQIKGKGRSRCEQDLVMVVMVVVVMVNDGFRLRLASEDFFESICSFLVDKVYFKFSISPQLVSLLVIATENIGMDVPEPDSVFATAIHPPWGF